MTADMPETLPAAGKPETLPARIITAICEVCEIGVMKEWSNTCRVCRLYEAVAALEYAKLDGLTVEAAVKKAERDFRKAPAGASEGKYDRVVVRV